MTQRAGGSYQFVRCPVDLVAERRSDQPFRQSFPGLGTNVSADDANSVPTILRRFRSCCGRHKKLGCCRICNDFPC